ncbi:hypothetical protein [Pseudalkalibacillus berkeleyi]|uniref:Uncharacterized protein n=1 Tax=Pseudalkalibacillus berkeleyi TaxID=1069813 RepID=A0ABS9H0R0_9BACL|nr:hypothetical protein [Pseudalkalibacillus berkeleyi]MCF6138587.1 hypothetical protein [Pseudalkalibacillus berkeleyi]
MADGKGEATPTTREGENPPMRCNECSVERKAEYGALIQEQWVLGSEENRIRSTHTGAMSARQRRKQNMEHPYRSNGCSVARKTEYGAPIQEQWVLGSEENRIRSTHTGLISAR